MPLAAKLGIYWPRKRIRHRRDKYYPKAIGRLWIWNDLTHRNSSVQQSSIFQVWQPIKTKIECYYHLNNGLFSLVSQRSAWEADLALQRMLEC